MKVLTPAALTSHGGSLRLLRFAFPPFSSQPRDPSDGRFPSRLSATGYSRLRHHPAGSPRVHAESDSYSYRLAVRLQLLPTPPLGDAVAFGYTVTTHYDGDLHPADKAASQTHWMTGTSPVMTALFDSVISRCLAKAMPRGPRQMWRRKTDAKFSCPQTIEIPQNREIFSVPAWSLKRRSARSHTNKHASLTVRPVRRGKPETEGKFSCL
jgi:hypothetical protein